MANEQIISTVIKFKRGLASAWEANKDIVLKEGEPGFELDTGKLKIGNNFNTWEELEYVNDRDYSNLSNKPTLNGHEITGNLLSEDLDIGITDYPLSNLEIERLINSIV